MAIVAVVLLVAPVASTSEPPAAVTYRTVGRLGIQSDVFRPDGPGPFPVVLWIHGGALVFGDRRMLPRDERERYLRAGLAVVSIDYRLAPETKLDGILEDLEAAHAWLQRDGASLGLDPRRLAVVGHSAGGYLALMAGVRFRPRPQAVVSFYGYGDVAGPWYSRPDPGYLKEPAVSEEEAAHAVGRQPLAQGDEARRFTYYRYARQRGLWPQLVAGHDPDREPHGFDSLCPVRNVTPDFPPTLLLHGDRDADVPYERSVEMAKALESAGVSHELVTLPGLGHVFDIEGRGVADPVVARAFDRAVAFLSGRLGAAQAHPRLLLDPSRVDELRSRLDTTHRFLWERYLQDLPRMVAVSKREAPLEDARYDGDLVPELAFAWLMTGRADLLDVAKTHLLRLTVTKNKTRTKTSSTSCPATTSWGWRSATTGSTRPLAGSAPGRRAPRPRARPSTGITKSKYWRNQYFQNHSHSNTAALAFAAAALWGEDERAPAWLATTEGFFDKTFSVLPEDGSSLEGYAYAGYGGEYLLLEALLERTCSEERDRPALAAALSGLPPPRAPAAPDGRRVGDDVRGRTPPRVDLDRPAPLHALAPFPGRSGAGWPGRRSACDPPASEAGAG
jgi:acetyl esterase/lipase